MVVTAPRMRLTPSLPSGPDPVEGSSPSESWALALMPQFRGFAKIP
jgi:hypothetical protein